MKNLRLTIVLACLWLLTAPHGAAQDTRPSLACPASAWSNTGGDGTRWNPVKTSSLRTFVVTAALTGTPGVTYDDVYFKSGNVPPMPPTVKLGAAQVGWFGRRTLVPTKLVLQVSGGGPAMLATFVIPIPEEEQRAKIDAHLDDQERAGRTSPFATMEEFRARKADIFTAINLIFTENRVGLFELTCTYTSAGREAWQGTVQSQPFYVEITDDGDWFTQADRLNR